MSDTKHTHGFILFFPPHSRSTPRVICKGMLQRIRSRKHNQQHQHQQQQLDAYDASLYHHPHHLDETHVQVSFSATTVTLAAMTMTLSAAAMAFSALINYTSASRTRIRANPNDSRDCWCSATAHLVCNEHDHWLAPFDKWLAQCILEANSHAHLLLPCLMCFQAVDTMRARKRYKTLLTSHWSVAFHVCLRQSGISPPGLALCS